MALSVYRIGDVLPCRILKRVSRFVLLVNVHGEVRKAHLTNTGRLLDLLKPGRGGLVVRLRTAKTGLRLIAVRDIGGLYTIVDTILQNTVLAKAVPAGAIPWLKGCSVVKRNRSLAHGSLG